MSKKQEDELMPLDQLKAISENFVDDFTYTLSKTKDPKKIREAKSVLKYHRSLLNILNKHHE